MRILRYRQTDGQTDGQKDRRTELVTEDPPTGRAGPTSIAHVGQR